MATRERAYEAEIAWKITIYLAASQRPWAWPPGTPVEILCHAGGNAGVGGNAGGLLEAFGPCRRPFFFAFVAPRCPARRRMRRAAS